MDHHTDEHHHEHPCIHDRCGCAVTLQDRKGVLLRTQVLGMRTPKRAIIQWDDTGKRQVMSFKELMDAKCVEDGACLLSDEEKACC